MSPEGVETKGAHHWEGAVKSRRTESFTGSEGKRTEPKTPEREKDEEK